MTKTKRNNGNNFPVFPSASALAGALDVPVRAILGDKSAGLAGFTDANRVDTSLYLKALILRGEKPEGEALDLDQTRAVLNKARADLLVRNGQLAAGELVSVLWCAQVIDQAFSMFNKGIRGRINNLANLLCLCARVPDFAEALRQVTGRLENDGRELGNAATIAKAEMLLRLRQGPPEAGGATAWARFEDRARALADKLSDSARRELHSALESQSTPQA